MYNLVALLPIKCHSERVPGKNFRLFGSRPLFQWIIDTLLSINEIDKIVINTDAEDVLIKNGLKKSSRILIRERKSELCGDFVDINKILNDDIICIKSKNYIMTHVTNPLMESETIKNALSLYLSSPNADSLFSVNKFQTRLYDDKGDPLNHNPNVLERTQDLKPFYEENSCLYIFNSNSFKCNNNRIGQTPIMFETPKLESIDIDDKDDWEIANALIKVHKN